MRVKEGDQTHGFRMPSWYVCRFRSKAGERWQLLSDRPGKTGRLLAWVTDQETQAQCGIWLHTRHQTHEPEGNPSHPFSYSHPTCFQNSLEATDKTLNSTRWGDWTPLPRQPHSSWGASCHNQVSLVSSVPLHGSIPVLVTFYLSHQSSEKLIFPKRHFHQVIHSYHEPKSFLQTPPSAPNLGHGFWEPP